MKLALISDTHGFCPVIPYAAEAVIHAGDIAVDRRVVRNYLDDIYPWAERVGVPIYATFGNHDFLARDGQIPIDDKPSNLHFLVDQTQIINGVKFWFSPWSNLFGSWAYMLNERGLAERYAQIPKDTEIIVSHGPPKGYGDMTLGGDHVGSVSLVKRTKQLPQLKLIITGHIHEARGTYNMNGIPVMNVSYLDEYYRPAPPGVVMIEWPTA